MYPLGGFLLFGGDDPMTEERAKRKLTAILSADVKEYSRMMGEFSSSVLDNSFILDTAVPDSHFSGTK
jgi:hypothetical protein